jgi:hemolysin activation/secretion protein
MYFRHIVAGGVVQVADTRQRELGLDTLAVGLDRTDGNAKSLRDLLRRKPVAQHAQHLGLAVRKLRDQHLHRRLAMGAGGDIDAGKERVARAGLSGALAASFGLDGLGARAATASLPLSRAGAEPAFRKLEAALTYSTLLFEDTVSMSVAGKAQTAFGAALPASEQFGLGGFGWLSAFDGGWLQGDGGAALRTELAFPLTTGLGALLGDGWGGAASPYLFAAAGITRLEKPTAVEAAVTRASAVGAGLRFALSERASPNALTLTLEVAHGEASGLDSRNRFNMRLISRF